MKAVTDQLTEDGVKLFAEAFDKLLAAVEKRAKKPRHPAREASSTNCRPISRNRSSPPSMIGTRTTKSSACGPTTPPSGPTPTKANGSAGSASSKIRSQSAIVSRKSQMKSLPAVSRMPCFSAWAAPASASKFSNLTFGKIVRLIPNFSFSTPPTPLRSKPSNQSSISPKPSSSSPASPAARSSRISSSNISLSA